MRRSLYMTNEEWVQEMEAMRPVFERGMPASVCAECRHPHLSRYGPRRCPCGCNATRSLADEAPNPAPPKAVVSYATCRFCDTRRPSYRQHQGQPVCEGCWDDRLEP